MSAHAAWAAAVDTDLPRSSALLALPALLFTGVLFIVPLVLMLSRAFTDPAPGLSNLEWMATTPVVAKIVWATLRFSLAASVISVALGYLLAYVIVFAGGRTGALLLAVLLISFWLSVLVRCFALILMLRPNGPVKAALDSFGLHTVQLIRNEPGVLIGMTHYLIPFAALTALPVLRGIDRAVIGAARSMGASRLRVFRTITLPLSAPGIVAALGLCFVIALGFYITPALLGGGRVVMIAEFITFYVQNVLAWGKAAALAIFLLVVIASVFFIARLGSVALRRKVIA